MLSTSPLSYKCHLMAFSARAKHDSPYSQFIKEKTLLFHSRNDSAIADLHELFAQNKLIFFSYFCKKLSKSKEGLYVKTFFNYTNIIQIFAQYPKSILTDFSLDIKLYDFAQQLIRINGGLVIYIKNIRKK